MEWVDFWITGALKKDLVLLTTEFEFKEDDPPRYIFAAEKKVFLFLLQNPPKSNIIIAFAKCLLEKI